MRLIYTRTGKPVNVGDRVTLSDGTKVTVQAFPQPHKPAASGYVFVKACSTERRYYVSVIGAEWVEREDQPATPPIYASVAAELRKRFPAARIFSGTDMGGNHVIVENRARGLVICSNDDEPQWFANWDGEAHRVKASCREARAHVIADALAVQLRAWGFR